MIESLVDVFRAALAHLQDLQGLVKAVGYVGLTIIVFAETGLLVGFFLPGDSLLLAAGLVSARPEFGLDVWVLGAILTVAAVVGDATGYGIGRKAGAFLYERQDSFFFRRSHLLKAHEFYEKHGGKTIILARFVPIVRTFAPTVAGVARMSYPRFAVYNVIGAVAWIWSFLLAGHFLAQIVPNVDKYMHYLVAFFFVVPGLPVVWKIFNERRASRRSKDALAAHAVEMREVSMAGAGAATRDDAP